DSAARKGDLASMAPQMFGALGQQDGKALGPVDQRHQHGGGAQLPRRKHAGIELMIAAVAPAAPIRAEEPAPEYAADVALGQALGRRGYGVPGSCPSGKNVCPLHTPSSVPCGVCRSSASSTSS